MPRGDDWPGRTAPVLVIDLDGTVLRINSFPRWVLFLMFGPIRGIGAVGRIRLTIRATWLLLLRKLHRIDHGALLAGLQRAWSDIPARLTDTLTGPLQAKLLRQVRPNLRPLLDMVASGRVDAVLATAAAGDYAEGLGRRLGFRHVLATPPAGPFVATINAGTRKRDSVLAFLESVGWKDRPFILLTDHIDDLPLMRLSTRVCWFGPADRAQAAIDASGTTEFVVCRTLDAGGVLSAIETATAQAARFSRITAS